MKHVVFFLAVAIIGCMAASPLFAVLAGGKGPIAIDAAQLEVLQSEGRAIFSGNVVARQDEMTLQSERMTVYYNAEKQGDNSSGFGAMSRIDADGSVSLVTPGESANAARGVYDAIRNKVFLYGDVVLRRGGNTLNGSTLEYDLVSGSSVLSGGTSGSSSQPSSSGRVRGLFVPEAGE